MMYFEALRGGTNLLIIRSFKEARKCILYSVFFAYAASTVLRAHSFPIGNASVSKLCDQQ